MTEPKRWSYSAGERGTNRARVYEGRAGALYLEYWEDGNRHRYSLGHKDREGAKREARATATRFTAGGAPTGKLTLGALFDIYVTEVTPRKGHGKRAHDRRAARTFLQCFGRDRPVMSLTLRDWDAFIEQRRHGAVGPSGRPVGNRQIEYDLAWFRAVMNWATKAGWDGKPLLSRNPFAGYSPPRELNPRRPVMTEAQYQALCAAMANIDWRAEVALVLANETGRRISAIRHLRWSDIDFDGREIVWRPEHDKIGFRHVTRLSEAALGILEKARRSTAAIGDAWILPAVRKAGRPCPRGTLDRWFTRAAREAGLELPAHSGWHSLRRKFATELKALPLRDLCHLGGWKDPKTLLTCYQQPDKDAMRVALEARRPFGESVVSIGAVSTDTIAKRVTLT